MEEERVKEEIFYSYGESIVYNQGSEVNQSLFGNTTPTMDCQGLKDQDNYTFQ